MIGILCLAMFIGLIFSAVRGYFIIEPPVLLMASWTLMAVVLLASVIDYGPPVVSMSSLGLVLTATLSFVIGSAVFRDRGAQVAAGGDRGGTMPGVLRLSCIVAASVYLVLVPADVTLRGLWPEVLQLDLAALRSRKVEAFYSYSHTPLSLALGVSRPFCIFWLLLLPHIKKADHRPSFLAVGVLSGVALVLENLYVGGRSLLALVVLALSFSLALASIRGDGWKRWRLASVNSWLGSWAGVRYLLFIMLLGYGFLAWFPAARNPDLAGKVDTYLGFTTGNSTIADYVVALEDNGVPNLTILAYGSSYLTAPLMRLTHIMDDTDLPSRFLLGSYNFPQFGNVRSLLTGEEPARMQIRREIRDSSPYGENPWVTGLADLLVDFGYVGTVVFMFGFGCISQMLFSRAVRSTSPEYAVITSLLSVNLLSFAFTSRFQMSALANTVIVALCFLMVRWALQIAAGDRSWAGATRSMRLRGGP